ncbi:MAG: hypothetical protein KGH74_02105 [Candidatus Micrarchaeota archaeon]|nr:hypothetical protein [Candidatus Micrarchaeota archaeon]
MLGSKAKAPGKILWLGGYSALEKPNKGFVTTVDSYVNVEVKKLDGMKLVLNSISLNETATGTIADNSRFEIRTSEEMELFRTAVELSLSYVSALGIRLGGMEVAAYNDPGFSYSMTNGKLSKSGLGSSAAVTVATIGAVLHAYGVDTGKDDCLHKLSQLSHSVATGKTSSGFDIAAATHGTIIYERYTPEITSGFPTDYSPEELLGLIKRDWDYKIERFSMPGIFRTSYASFVGEGMSTKMAISKVFDFKKRNPSKYVELMASINSAASRSIEALRRIGKDGSNERSLDEFKTSFNEGRFATKELGVESGVGIEDDYCTRLIEESCKNGAFVAKLPGAGGMDAIAALSIGGREKALRKFWGANKSLSVIDVRIGNSGFSSSA